MGSREIVNAISGGNLQVVAAGATANIGQSGGKAGDIIKGILIKPATTSPGAVSIQDAGGAADTVFPGGASSVGSLIPFFVPYPATSVAGAWKVICGANISATVFGEF